MYRCPSIVFLRKIEMIPCLHYLNSSVVTLLPTFTPVCFLYIVARMIFLKFKFSHLTFILKILKASVCGRMYEDRPYLPVCPSSYSLYPQAAFYTAS